MIFETHAHFDDERYNEDRDELIKSLPAAGIGKVVNVAAGLAGIRDSIALAGKYDFFYAAAGIHPSEIVELNEENFKELEAAFANEKVVALGEIGLDYYYEEPERELQKYWFERQLEVAHKVNKPLIIHSRDACQDTMEIMKANKAEELGGVIHCYSYSLETARQYLDMGFYLGIGGVVTFKKSRVLKEVVEYMPLDRIVTETDCPYLTPEPHRGKRNDSTYLRYVVDKIAEIKGISTEEVEEITYNNAMKMYRLEK